MAPALLMGLGFGGFVDGIVLHQILQWHHMLTATGDHPADTVAGLETNTLADGLFHMGTWVLVFVGTLLTVRAWQAGRLAPPWRTHAGLLLAGWGLFNLVEGVVDHHLLGLHNVRDDVAEPLWWNLGFLASGGCSSWPALHSSSPAATSWLGPARPTTQQGSVRRHPEHGANSDHFDAITRSESDV
jgi:uncharacterized membrane protein